MYSSGDYDTHMEYNHIIAMSNYDSVKQKQYQSLQDYWDQLTAYRKVGLKVGSTINGANKILKE